jgi:hypothetical protein
MMRKVRADLLLIKAVIYRGLTTGMQVMVTFLYLHQRGIVDPYKMAVEVSIIWNLINTLLYFCFDYGFSSIFQIGRER